MGKGVDKASELKGRVYKEEVLKVMGLRDLKPSSVEKLYSQLHISYYYDNGQGELRLLGTNKTLQAVPELCNLVFYTSDLLDKCVYGITFNCQVGDWGSLEGMVSLNQDLSKTVGFHIFTHAEKVKARALKTEEFEAQFAQGISLVNGTVSLVDDAQMGKPGEIEAIAGATSTSHALNQQLAKSFAQIRLLLTGPLCPEEEIFPFVWHPRLKMIGQQLDLPGDFDIVWAPEFVQAYDNLLKLISFLKTTIAENASLAQKRAVLQAMGQSFDCKNAQEIDRLFSQLSVKYYQKTKIDEKDHFQPLEPQAENTPVENLLTYYEGLVDGEKVVGLTFSGGAQKGIFLPSACGGRGTCGACKVQVLSDVGPLLPTELPHLSPSELANHMRLGCQVKIKKNLQLAMPEELFSVKRYKCSVEKIIDLTYDIKLVNMLIKDGQTIDFKAGQYSQIVIPPYTWKKVLDSVGAEKAEAMQKTTLAFNERMGVAKRPNIPSFVLKGEANNPETIQRAYSMSNSPSDNKHIQMMIRWVPAGASSTYVHSLLKEGQDIECVGPFGHFYLRETKAPMVCVAGGSGMAPIKSIIYSLYEKGEREREIWYFFGARTGQDLFMVEELNELMSKMPNFRFIPALSDPTEQDNWQGETGIITQVLDRYIKNSIQGNPASFEGYLCGSPGMLDACVKVMKENGMQEDKIYFDKF
ncbi:UNVERIFIED_CONTAM: hypothetical protein PYX00_011904 [Menopon gallinae]|uniref:Uncharacterized protein n=1 Tax=Menopon gallinae TaxID=328185 RepID=A0AAW2H900_9NEOP